MSPQAEDSEKAEAVEEQVGDKLEVFIQLSAISFLVASAKREIRSMMCKQ